MSNKTYKYFAGARLKIERANRHIVDLEAEIGAFLNRKPYRIVVEDDPEPNMHRWVARVREQVPCDLSTFIGDAVHNLRSALDLLACDLVRLNDGNVKGVYFPIAKSKDRLERRIEEVKISRTSTDVLNLIRAMQPYTGGNNTLRGLHDLDIADKHKLLIPVTHIVGIPNFIFEGNGLHITVRDCYIEEPLEDGLIIVRMPAPQNVKIGQVFEGAFTIGFGEDQPFKGESVIPTLRQLSELVDGIIETFAGYCSGRCHPLPSNSQSFASENHPPEEDAFTYLKRLIADPTTPRDRWQRFLGLTSTRPLIPPR